MEKTKADEASENKYSSDGSLTLEAALAVPVYIFLLTAVMFIFRVIYVEEIIHTELIYAVREATIAAYASDKGTEILADGFFLKERLKEEKALDLIDGGISGISLLKTRVEDEMVIVEADYTINFPIKIFLNIHYDIDQSAAGRLWTGYSGDEEEESDYVYITPYGNAYHASASCRYLDLSIKKIQASDIKTERNKDGAKYYKCSCVKGKQSFYYVTEYGREYHMSLSCSDLKRTVKRVKLEDVEGRHACSKCCN